MTPEEEQLRYPIGRFKAPLSYNKDGMLFWIDDLSTLPTKLRHAVTSLTEQQLNTQYRPGGWTIRQVVHHMADSHMNSLTRIKLALTEDNPTIKPYEEGDWAIQTDYRLPVESSLKMLEGIHLHMVTLFENLTDAQWERTFFHPASGDTVTLKKTLATYSWHSKHHLAHVTETVKRFL